MFNGELLLMWFLASTRAAGLMLVSPVFSSRTLPAPVRIMMALFLAFVVALMQKGVSIAELTIGAIVVAMVREIFVGLLMGWTVRLTLSSVEVASHIISSELGFTMGQQIDPMSDTSESAVGQLLMSFGSMLFFISNAHQAVLGAFVKSFEVAPMGMFRGNEAAATNLVQMTGKIFHTGLQIAAPLVAINFIISLTFSILGKAAPSTNVFGESFAVRIVVGLTLLGLTMFLAAQILLDIYKDVPGSMFRIVP